MTRLFLSPPHMSDRERDFLLAAFDSNWIAPLGPMVDGFEQDLICYLTHDSGVDGSNLHALALSSGTAALHLAMMELGVGPGDRVLCSSLTFSASANAIRYVGAEPVFVDSSESAWNLDPALVAEELDFGEKRSMPYKAVIAVDLYGDPADLRSIQDACRDHGTALVEDAAEALGADCRGRKCGTWGEMAVLSFNGNKILTTSGGGMLLSPDVGKIEHARKLATQARDPAPHYQHSEIGYNYRMSNLLAAVGRGQLEWLDERVHRKQETRSRYEHALDSIPGVSFLPLPSYGKSNCWLTCIIIDPENAGLDREAILRGLEKHDIESRPVWKPMHIQPVFRDCRFVGSGVCERLFEKGLCLPSGSSMTDENVDLVAELVHDMISRARRKENSGC